MALKVLQLAVDTALQTIEGLSDAEIQIPVNYTKSDIQGDFTITLFPLVKILKMSPQAISNILQPFLFKSEIVDEVQLVGGFLNVFVKTEYWSDLVISTDFSKVTPAPQSQLIVVEFASPNTNKPLHLGHIRNILLGESMARIFSALGHQAIRVQIVNDRGIAICKSMLIYNLQGNGKTPASTGIKGDHFVGDLYVDFESSFKEEYSEWQQTEQAKMIYETENEKSLPPAEFYARFKNKYFNEYSLLGISARKLLQEWEAGDPNTVSQWEKMNGWVYEGFAETYNKLGIQFDRSYYESNTYLLGKEIIEKGLQSCVFYREADGSVWVDLTDQGLDKKILLRADGTSVYITQDIGTAVQRHEELNYERMIYVVADEQNYHFDVLFNILKLLKYPFAEGLYHLSYGMVELPTGKMKSREGTVVDADDLIAEVSSEASAAGEARGDLSHLDSKEKSEIFSMIAMAALKYHMLKVQAKKKMVFDPKDSVDMQGQTGPYIQNAYVRILSILRKSDNFTYQMPAQIAIAPQELILIKEMVQYNQVVSAAATEYDPSILAQYLYQLAKSFHRFYHDLQVLNAKDDGTVAWRITLIKKVADVLKTGMDLLGIEMPERM